MDRPSMHFCVPSRLANTNVGPKRPTLGLPTPNQNPNQLPEATRTIHCNGIWEAGKPLVIEEVEVAPPQALEVLLKILFTSLCHTDVYFWEAKSVGEGVTDLKPGDHVLPVFTGSVRNATIANLRRVTCVASLGSTLTGVMLNDGKSRFSIKGQPIYHELEPEKFITHQVLFWEINKAFELMLKGESLRCIIRMNA
ncbi:Alcohol dehydrogenase superfamily, zinc-type [Parasponia andersonii]|uniref:alcohol dehydrogenase n=1 Tax=Parasponia andersonii TaxID=3476 RepID=A0A2P5DGQ1_PARAD|nr:Alcohol dehydrogenase superfamily, zinc-type [Parasponia andersonii]